MKTIESLNDSGVRADMVTLNESIKNLASTEDPENFTAALQVAIEHALSLIKKLRQLARAARRTEKARQKSEPVNRHSIYVGFCPICERDVKLKNKAGFRFHGELEVPALSLVHHGGGSLGCYGTGELPYEISTAACDVWVSSCEEDAAIVTRYIESKQSEPQNKERDDRIAEYRIEFEEATREIKRMKFMIANWQKRPLRSVGTKEKT